MQFYSFTKKKEKNVINQGYLKIHSLVGITERQLQKDGSMCLYWPKCYLMTSRLKEASEFALSNYFYLLFTF